MSSGPVLILGASSGFGAATARAFAQGGRDIIGVHLDRRSTLDRVERLRSDIEACGQRVLLFNLNAADDQKRTEILNQISDFLGTEQISVLIHSLAFGTLKPFVPRDPESRGASRKQLEMTIDVMANSLVYWVQDLVERKLMGEGGRIFAMTSMGSHQAWADYGPVSAAKAALESHVRQLCLELAPRKITINAIMAGVTQTPALDKIPSAETIMNKSRDRNPHDRLTLPEDVAACLVELARPGTYWMTGNVIRVDGGEDFCA
jgi:NAD(P)-dependent dehydrogenase (short-subunit alcohol dehydrogenase family)